MKQTLFIFLVLGIAGCTTHHNRLETKNITLPPLPDWAIGPFKRAARPIIKKSKSPWEKRRTGNPSLLVVNGRLYSIYRSMPRPRPDDLDSQLGLAWSDDGIHFERYARNPIFAPSGLEYEQRGCEDARIYRYKNTYYMYYMGVWDDPTPDPAFDWEQVNVNIYLATSTDLINWKRHPGPIVPYKLANGWAKSAVIPHDPYGVPVRIDGKFVMYVTEVGTPEKLIGYSKDMVNWKFKKMIYLHPNEYIKQVYEAQTAIVKLGESEKEDEIILSYYYEPKKGPKVGQGRFMVKDHTKQIDFYPAPAGNWGGLIQYKGQWCRGFGKGTLSFAPIRSPWLKLTDMKLSSDKIVARKPFSVTVTANQVGGTKTRKHDVRLFVDDEEIIKKITLTPGKQTEVTFKRIKLKSGNHKISIADMEKSILVN